ncbi:apolipoprotein N-acyltransferase [Natronoglycomyces albus]|uniref:Apolipoprotein N-acyltransferase n=1 Tax=Natronoglycomyces albus TaxID=2811108 RepID=A0A895XNQ9_9ACTN|nr:apolipoprotein N-acyltransferase [Natronoglycomyces albus]QSB06767.1 apolipoprotein N-acyltransferase [Natronoglycomyces albus]
MTTSEPPPSPLPRLVASLVTDSAPNKAAPGPRFTLPVALALAIIAGLALVAAFPPIGWWPLAPISVALMAAAVHRRRPRGGFGIGFVAGLAFFLPLLSWASTQVGQWPWIFLSALQAVFLGLIGLALAAASGLIDRHRALWPLAIALAWVAQEALRSRQPWGGFPWGRLAFSQADSPTVAAAWLGGAPLVTFITALAAGTLLTAAWRRRWFSKPSPQTLTRPLALAGTAAILMVVPMWLPLHLSAPDGDDITVGVVQGNVPRIGLDFNAQRRAVLDNHVQGTIELAQRADAGEIPRPDLVVWPENASDIDPIANEDAYEEISRAAEAIAAPIVVGGIVRDQDGLHNASLVWDPVTGPGYMYSKQHPVPFAEYVPAKDFFRTIAGWIDQRMADGLDSVAGFTPGDQPGVIPVADTAISGIICFEVAYDGLVAEGVREGSEIIAVQTNNATFNNAEATQQLAMVQLRSVEHARHGLMASTVGVSGFTDEYGNVSQATTFNTPAALSQTLQLGEATTPATKLGILPEMIMVALALIALGYTVAVRTRDRRAGKG